MNQSISESIKENRKRGIKEEKGSKVRGKKVGEKNERIEDEEKEDSKKKGNNYGRKERINERRNCQRGKQ